MGTQAEDAADAARALRCLQGALATLPQQTQVSAWFDQDTQGAVHIPLPRRRLPAVHAATWRIASDLEGKLGVAAGGIVLMNLTASNYDTVARETGLDRWIRPISPARRLLLDLY